jgi:hypothetical protein
MAHFPVFLSLRGAVVGFTRLDTIGVMLGDLQINTIILIPREVGIPRIEPILGMQKAYPAGTRTLMTWGRAPPFPTTTLGGLPPIRPVMLPVVGTVAQHFHAWATVNFGSTFRTAGAIHHPAFDVRHLGSSFFGHGIPSK